MQRGISLNCLPPEVMARCVALILQASRLTCASASLLLFVGFAAHAHPGGLNAEGCHNNRKTGEYHCHGGAHRAAPRPVDGMIALHQAPRQNRGPSTSPTAGLPPGCFVGPRGGTYTITKSGRKNYSGC
jgi:hypothetical protein